MSTDAVTTPQELDHEQLSTQFEDIQQQRETYIVGMWAFIVTEIMMFGAIFLIYTVYRTKYHPAFYEVHKHLDVSLGMANTFILLLSSLTMALAVRYAQLNRIKVMMMHLAATLVLAFAFLGVKSVEYLHKFQHHLFPGLDFQYENAGLADKARLFFSLYFGATGLHAVHIIIGILVIAAMMVRAARHKKGVLDFIPVEMIGMYWHFVDIVWIFLFPLLYLIPR